ncbi:MAG: Na+/H+ antiporter subunit E [Rubrivivax sp.]|nr:Na+/H+ antiporter subunit E [Rubrivivax sp.]
MKPQALVNPSKSLLVAVSWLLLRQSLALPDLITAAVLGLVLPLLVRGFLGQDPSPRRWGRALRFGALVLWDIVVSNITVARIVLSPWSRPRPVWLEVPYTLQHPFAVMLLAGIVTTTPGTVSCVVDEKRRVIVVHLLDGTDPAAVRVQIEQRYAQALKEIFE